MYTFRMQSFSISYGQTNTRTFGVCNMHEHFKYCMFMTGFIFYWIMKIGISYGHRNEENWQSSPIPSSRILGIWVELPTKMSHWRYDRHRFPTRETSLADQIIYLWNQNLISVWRWTRHFDKASHLEPNQRNKIVKIDKTKATPYRMLCSFYPLRKIKAQETSIQLYICNVKNYRPCIGMTTHDRTVLIMGFHMNRENIQK